MYFEYSFCLWLMFNLEKRDREKNQRKREMKVEERVDQRDGCQLVVLVKYTNCLEN